MEKLKKTKHLLATLLACALACALAASCACADRRAAPPTARNVDIPRYMGAWYEIARLPSPFQSGTFDALAVYEADGAGVKITNTATKPGGKTSQSKASAYIPDASDSSKLRVTFFWPFYGDYWILAVDDDYQWALVGTPDYKYLWLLSRSPGMERERAMEILGIAQSAGFDTSRAIFNEDLKNCPECRKTKKEPPSK